MKKYINERLRLFNEINSDLLKTKIDEMADSILNTHKKRGKVLLFGNGGSQSQASHLAADLLIRYKKNSTRSPITAFSLSSDNVVITAAANDFKNENSILCQLKTCFNPSDTALAFSTSGTSPNVINSLRWLNSQNNSNVYLLTGKLDFFEFNNVKLIETPFECSTAIIQEFHLFLIHILCETLESYE